MIPQSAAKALIVAAVLLSFLGVVTSPKQGFYLEIACSMAYLAGMHSLCLQFTAPKAFTDFCWSALFMLAGASLMTWQLTSLDVAEQSFAWRYIGLGFLGLIVGAWFQWRAMFAFGQAVGEPRFAKSGKMQMVGVLTLPLVVGIYFLVYAAYLQIQALMALKAR